MWNRQVPRYAQYQYNEEHGFETCMGFLLILRHVRYDFLMTFFSTVSHGPELSQSARNWLVRAQTPLQSLRQA